MRHGDGTYVTSLEPEALMRPRRARAVAQRQRPGGAARGAAVAGACAERARSCEIAAQDAEAASAAMLRHLENVERAVRE
jgi:DNA-binding FadR family transcriptional regulator